MTTYDIDPTSALIVVDVQNDFVDGSLPVSGGAECARAVGEYVARTADSYQLVVTTQDWHVDPGHHFSDEPDFEDTFPPHCRAGTEGAELHPALDEGFGGDFTSAVDAAVRKGQDNSGYSGFQGVDASGRDLDSILRAHGVAALDVIGIASSHCVAATALDGLERGYPVRVMLELSVGVSEAGESEAMTRVRDAGGIVIERPAT